MPTIHEIIGCGLIALPFIIITSVMIFDIGWRGALVVFGLLGAIIGCFVLGEFFIYR